MSGATRAIPAALVLAACLELAGCANVPPAAPPAPRGPAASSAAATPAPAAAVVDNSPSREALEVLATIPEPLETGDRTPAPPAAPGAPATPGVSAADTVSADVPVPTPTPVLGERPVPEVLAPTDTTAQPVAPAPPAMTGSPGTTGAQVRTPADACWRVQIAAPADRRKAEGYLEAGRSQLAVPLVIEKEKGLFKVRTRECMDGASADRLRRRALEAGFAGVFRFRGKRP